MRESLEQLLRAADVPSPERAEVLWTEYRSGGPGAEAAFTTLLAWHGLVIYRRIWGFVRSDAAEDVFQDVLAKLHRQRQKLATFEHVLRWLRTVAVRQCVDAHRRTARRKAREKSASRPEGEAPAGERFELQEMLAVALSKLSREHREAVALVFFEGMDKQDAAKVLGINRDTLADRLNVALSRLQKLVPAPAVLAAGGAVAVPTALSAPPPLPSVTRLGELAKAAWAKTAISGLRLWKVAALVGLAALGGVAWAAWPRPEPPPAVATVVTHNHPTPVESVPARNLRLFKAEVLPRQLAALKGLVIGDGEVVLRSVDAYDVRLTCAYELRHKSESLPRWVSAIRLVHDTCAGDPARRQPTRHTAVYFDLFGRGDWRPIDPDRPIVLWRNPLTGAEVVVKTPALQAAMAAFALLPQDERTVAELQALAARMQVAVAPLLGTWFLRGDPHAPRRIRLENGGTLRFEGSDLYVPEMPLYMAGRLDLSGRLVGLTSSHFEVTFSPDGRRVDFHQRDEWWSREPLTGPGK